MTFPPMPQIPTRDLEVLMDAFAYLLSTNSPTNEINWAIGDVGIGPPPPLPFGYITHVSEGVGWYTAGGGVGGLSAGGPQGQDDWNIPITLTIALEPHRYPNLLAATPPATSPFFPATLGIQALPYQEAPGYRAFLQAVQKVKGVLRTNSTIGGAASDTRIVESRYILQEIDNSAYRAARMTINTQQRRTRGN